MEEDMPEVPWCVSSTAEEEAANGEEEEEEEEEVEEEEVLDLFPDEFQLLPIERKQEEEEAQTKGIKRKRYVQYHKGFLFGFDHNN